MPKNIVFSVAGAPCVIMSLGPEADIDEAIASLPSGAAFEVVESENLPVEPRESWSIVGGALVVDAIALAAHAAKQLSVAANVTIEAGYCGRRLSLYGYFAQLNALKADGTIKPDQVIDLATLLDAAAWEQAVLDLAASSPQVVTWPAPPAALAALAALS